MAAAKTKVTIEYDKDLGGMLDSTIVVEFPDDVPTGATDEIHNMIRHLLSQVAVKSHAGRAWDPLDNEIIGTLALLTGMGCTVS